MLNRKDYHISRYPGLNCELQTAWAIEEDLIKIEAAAAAATTTTTTTITTKL